MSKSNQAASRITLGSSHLDGYNGPVDIVARGRRRWWHRLLRRHPAPRQQRVFADVKGSNARAWRRENAPVFTQEMADQAGRDADDLRRRPRMVVGERMFAPSDGSRHNG